MVMTATVEKVCQGSSCLIVAVKTWGNQQFIQTLNNKRWPSISVGYRWHSCLADSWWNPWSKGTITCEEPGSRANLSEVNLPCSLKFSRATPLQRSHSSLSPFLFLKQWNPHGRGRQLGNTRSISDKTQPGHMALIQQNTRLHGAVWRNPQASRVHRAVPTTSKYCWKDLLASSISLQPQ